ncbi:MAG: hypothetical protein ACLRPU_00435 [Enterococcus hulanensis]
MKYLMRTMSIVFLTLTFGIKGITVIAEEQQYKSNGQTSFYGTYEYDTNEENNKNEQGLNKSNSGKQLPTSGTKNYSSSGRAILPRTGDFIDPIYLYIGLTFWAGIIYLIFITKRKEDFTL